MAPVLIVLIVAPTVALLSLRTRATKASEDGLVQLQQLQSGGFLFCTGIHSCGTQTFQSWRVNPVELAAQVEPYLQGVLGIPPEVFSPVAQHWQRNPPSFKGRPVGLESIASFMKQVLMSDPFGTGLEVPYVTFYDKGHGQVVAITQKQLAFIVSNVIMGNDIATGNGLTATVERCAAKNAKPFVFSLLSLLAVLSQELATGGQGSALVAAVPGPKTDSWKARLETSTVAQTNVHKELGYVAGDFMAGGTLGQAMTDIAGTVVGGGAALCDLANSQDESLVQFYSEVLAFAFFAPPGKMLPVPWLLLGARRYMGTLTGESAASGPLMNRCGHIMQADWLNQDISIATTQVVINGEPRVVASSSFVAVASVCSGTGGGTCPNGMAVNNNCDSQRRHADKDISNWYQAFEPSMYAAPIQGAITSVIRRIGTGPWGAGVWWGDSQQYFLTVLLATSLLSNQPPLDYYLYDHFCENPGNQCFVLGAAGCAQCIMQSKVHNIKWSRCGTAGLTEMMQRFSGQQAKLLYLGLRNVGSPPAQVFDTLQQWQPTAAELAAPVVPTPPPTAPMPPMPAPVRPPVGYGGPDMFAPAPMPPVPMPPYGVPAGPAPAPMGVPVPVAAYGQGPARPSTGRCANFMGKRLFCFPWPPR